MFVSDWQVLSPSMAARPLRHKLEDGDEQASMPYPFCAENQLGFHVARNGIYQLIRALGYGPGDTVLMPAYHSGNEVLAVQSAGAKVKFFSVDRNMRVDLEEITKLCRKGPKALFIIHYLGWAQPVAELERICTENGVTLIEDCALALLSEHEGKMLGTVGDYSIFCLYKTLPVPAGGLLVQNRRPIAALESLHLESVSATSTLSQVVNLGLPWLRMRSDWAGRSVLGLKRLVGSALSALNVKRVPVGDMGFDVENANLGISQFSERLVKSFDFERIKQIRRRNFRMLDERLDGSVTKLDRRLEPGMCPLFFPIVVRDKHATWMTLKKRGVMATLFWNQGLEERQQWPHTQWLRDHVLELPIHQDVTPAHVEYMVTEIQKLDMAFP